MRSRRWGVVAVAVVVAAAAVVIPIASSAGDAAPANLIRARVEADRLLSLVHVPPGAVEHSSAPAFGGRGVLGAPAFDEATPNLVDAHHWWTVRGKATQVLAYVAARMPRGAKKLVWGWSGPRPVYHMKAFSLPPIPGVLAERVVGVSVVQLNSRTTAMRTDGEAVWITPRPASEKLPAGIQEIDITSTAFWGRSRILALSVTSPAEVQQIVGWINAMGIGQPGSINCPMLEGPTVTFVFRGAGGKALARASGMDFDGTSAECNTIALSVGGRAEPALIGGDFYKRLERLLGVKFDRGAMSSRRVTVLNVLSPDGIDGVRFGASSNVVLNRIDSLLQQNGTGYQRGGTCGLDHQIKWWDQWTASAEPALTVYFRRGAFAGYQVGDPPGPASVLRLQGGGWALATARGLRVGDRLKLGRLLYGHAFTLSFAQGGSWKLRTAHGGMEGYAWGMPTHGSDVSWRSYVATIDAGDVGCPAMTP